MFNILLQNEQNLSIGKKGQNGKSKINYFLLEKLTKQKIIFLTYKISLIEYNLDFDPKKELDNTNINYKDIIKSSSSERDSNSTSKKSIKIQSDYSADDLNSISSVEKITITDNIVKEKSSKNQAGIVKDNFNIMDDFIKTPPPGNKIKSLLSIFNKNASNNIKTNEIKSNHNKSLIVNKDISTALIDNNYDTNINKVTNKAAEKIGEEKNKIANTYFTNDNLDNTFKNYNINNYNNYNTLISPIMSSVSHNKNIDLNNDKNFNNFSLSKNPEEIPTMNKFKNINLNDNNNLNDRTTLSTKANSNKTNLSSFDSNQNYNLNKNQNQTKEKNNENVKERETLNMKDEKDLINQSVEQKPFSRVSDSIFLKMNIYANNNSKVELNSTIHPKEYKTTVSNSRDASNIIFKENKVLDEPNSIIDKNAMINLNKTIPPEKSSDVNYKIDKNINNANKTFAKKESINSSNQTDINDNLSNFNEKINNSNLIDNHTNYKSNINQNLNNSNLNNQTSNVININSNNTESKSIFSRASNASNSSDPGSTTFTVLDAQMTNVFDSNSISNNNFDTFCEAFLISGAALHNPQTVLDSEKFPAFCGHDMCSSFEAYKPQIIYRYPLKDTKQLELNSLVTKQF